MRPPRQHLRGFSARIELPRMGVQVSTCLSFLICLAAAASVLEAQSSTFTDRTEVRAVHLDVLVVDKKGIPVTTLTRDDFLVKRDGEPVELDFFDQPVLPKSGENSASIETSGDDLPMDHSAPVEWIIYVDDLRLDGASRKRTLRQLEQLLADWQEPGKLRLVIQRVGETLEFGPFLAAEPLLDALENRPKAAVRGLMSRLARTRTMTDLASIREACTVSGRDICTDCWSEQLSRATQHAVNEVSRVEESAFKLRDLLIRLDPSAGRRSLLYVGTGLPLLAGAAPLWSLGDICTDRRSEIEGEVAYYRQQKTLEELGMVANAQRVALHLLDAGGLRHTTDANDLDHFRNLHAGLQTLAEQTGGRAVINANNVTESVLRSVRDESARYSLGFTLSDPPDGRMHRIKVSLKDEAARGRTLRYRRTYWDSTPNVRLVHSLRAALTALPEKKPSHPTIELTARKVADLDRRNRKVELVLRIPAETVVLLPQGEGVTSGLMSLAVLSEEQGSPPEETRLKQMPLGTGGLQPINGYYDIVLGTTVTKGNRVFVVGVRDETTGELYLARTEHDLH